MINYGSEVQKDMMDTEHLLIKRATDSMVNHPASQYFKQTAEKTIENYIQFTSKKSSL